MDNDITLEQIVAVDDVFKRWHKKASFLNELAETHIISLYVLNDSRVRPTDGKPVYFCSQVSSIYCYDYSSEAYDTDNIFLRPEEVAAYEKAHPEILWEPAHPEEAIMREYGENIPADVVRRWLKMSPMQFVDFMNSGEGPISSWEEGYRKHAENLYPEAPFFSTQDLRDESFTINVYDWLDWQKARASAGKAVGEAASGLSDVAASNAGRDAVLVGTDAELSALQEENAVLKTALEQAQTGRKEQGGQSLTPQQKAAQVRSETALNAWKSKIGAMVKVAVQIGKEGPKERQAGDFYAYFNEQNVELSDEQMKIFRAGLPDEYKDTVGGKAGKI